MVFNKMAGNKSSNNTLLIDIGQGLSMMLGLPRINIWKTPERPKVPKTGTFGFNTQTNSLEYFDGSDWMTAPLSKEE